ncbi:MAG: ATP-binding cassette domain-containing protein [Propionibacteriaceae bacterium]|nr:ATP-binding cassette domain-containing protein [Propionibacteriaceae bacterium]
MISTSNLTKRYGSTTVVSDVTFRAEPGRVTGFLGSNGAGKSTTMRMICGMTAPTSGSALVLGQNFRELKNPGRQIGVLLDAGAQHMGRTGREVLALSALQMGVPRRRIQEVLDIVQLDTKAASKRVGAYSLGMRQRLGLANALLGSPQVLMLDEPANGLDPSGIRWMRTLLRQFADDGGTVLLSSHLLHEVELIADDLVVIEGGRIVARGAVQDFTANGSHSLEEAFFSLTA